MFRLRATVAASWRSLKEGMVCRAPGLWRAVMLVVSVLKGVGEPQTGAVDGIQVAEDCELELGREGEQG